MKLIIRSDSDDGKTEEIELANGASIEVDNPNDLQFVDQDSIAQIIPSGNHLIIVAKDGSSITLKNAREGYNHSVSVDPQSGTLVFAAPPSSYSKTGEEEKSFDLEELHAKSNESPKNYVHIDESGEISQDINPDDGKLHNYEDWDKIRSEVTADTRSNASHPR